jgi:hypothetical protein
MSVVRLVASDEERCSPSEGLFPIFNESAGRVMS